MKILFATLYEARFGLGGAERVAMDLAYALKRDFGDQVRFMINAGDAFDELKTSEIPVTEISAGKWDLPGLISELGREIDNFKPDIIHSHHRYLTFLLDLLFKNKTKILHTEEVLRKDKRFLFRYGHFAAACHDSVKENLIHHYHVPETNVRTILNAVARPKADPETLSRIKAQYPDSGKKLTGLCVARFEEQKGHRYLIDAVSLLPRQYQNKLRIFLAGDGSLKETCMNQAKDKGVQDVFIFLGYCRQVPEFLALCDFTVLSSVWEGSPLTLLLSYGAHKPVIGTDIEGIRGVVQQGKSGYLAKPADPESMMKILKECIENPQELTRLADQTESLWNQYSSMSRTASEYRALYQKITG